jgi:ribosome biogenesis GTPase A
MNENKTNINWYPGHMAKTKRQILEDLKLIDVIVEVLDARIPIASQNPDIKEFSKNKKRVVVLNKIDLADENETVKWIKHFKNQDIPAIGVDCNSGKGVNEVIRTIKEVAKENQEKFADKGRVGKSIRIMILGIPNVGKSTFINKITNRKAAQVGNKPGVTRQKQWVRVDNDIELMDTPGILWPKFESQTVGMNLAFTGTIKDDVLEKTEIAFELLKFLLNNYIDNVTERFKLDKIEIESILNNKDVDENDNYVEILDTIAKKRGAIISGGRIDYEKISGIILDEFRSGKIGRITIEKAK